jgi:hypothetical protein
VKKGDKLIKIRGVNGKKEYKVNKKKKKKKTCESIKVMNLKI